jgi:glycosyltransferase involved in cell wall biosynthesis
VKTDILLLHQNMPGQFKHLAPALARLPKTRVAFIGGRKLHMPGVRTLTYPEPKPAGAETHGYVKTLEAHVRRGQAVARLALGLQKEGFDPALILAHPGWGEALFLRDLFPAARILSYAEFYYRGSGADIGFDPEFPDDLDIVCRARVRNSHLLLGLEAADAAIAPTQWQKSVHPVAFHPKIEVIFDGIDTAKLAPDPKARFQLPEGPLLRPGDEVLTYVARNLEPYRGFHIFMRALPELLAARPGLQVLVAGGDEVSYGRRPAGGGSWREAMLAEVPLGDAAARVHFLGRLPYARYVALLHVSAVHLYLTYPFVLSWSCLEAMAAGCLLVGSDTAPVTEVLRDSENGLLTPFHSPQEVARRVLEALALPGASAAALREGARRTVQAAFALDDCLAAQLALARRLIG